MDSLEVGTAGEQWRTRVAPTCWYSTEVGWTASSYAPHLHMAINDVSGGRVYHICDILSEFLGHNFLSGH